MNNKITLSAIKWLRRLFVLLLCFAATPSYAIETITYYHTDGLGSPVAGTDTSGALIWKEDYKPYGERIRKQIESDKNTRWFTGHPEDKETGLTYAGARFYDSVTGRFLAVDPVGFKEDNLQMFNRYAYANNNPYKYVDPDGQESFLVSRSLGFTTLANHNFIVSNAKYLGDPDARVSSFGDVGNDTMGRVDKNTKGFSAGTNDTDMKAWLSLSTKEKSATYRKINAKDSVVDILTDRVDKGLEYSMVPSIQGGVNSNTGAGAVAKMADGGSSSVKNGISQPGSEATGRIKFNGKPSKKQRYEY